HGPSRRASLTCIEVSPRTHPGWPRRWLAPLRHYTDVLLTTNDLVSPLVPALIEGSGVVMNPSLRCLQGCVHGTGRVVAEERTLRRILMLVPNHRDRLVRQVFVEMVAILGTTW